MNPKNLGYVNQVGSNIFDELFPTPGWLNLPAWSSTWMQKTDYIHILSKGRVCICLNGFCETWDSLGGRNDYCWFQHGK